MISQSKTKISFFTLGCRLNQSETSVLENTFNDGAYSIVEFDQPADIAVINTCTVTENGDADAKYLVAKAARLNPLVKIALIGCQAQIQKGQLSLWPNVRWVVGNARKLDLKSIIQTHTEEKPHVIAPAIPKESFTQPIAATRAKHTRGQLKVQDGCDFFCSFCEIPYARGRARSRDFNDLLKEANILANYGHKEIVLTGINIGTYHNNGKSIVDIIKALEHIPGIKRIRISSIEPTTVPEELIGMMSKGGKLCRYLHLPLQSASNEILMSMKRKYSLEMFDAFIQTAVKKIPQLTIGTDVIVGFPTETLKDFNQTISYLTDAPMMYFHVFSYSSRHLAKSKNAPKRIAPKEIQKRSEMLRSLSQRKKREALASLIGTSQTVLFENPKNKINSGLTDHYIRVVAESGENLQGQIREVQIRNTDDQYAYGVLQ